MPHHPEVRLPHLWLSRQVTIKPLIARLVPEVIASRTAEGCWDVVLIFLSKDDRDKALIPCTSIVELLGQDGPFPCHALS